MCGICGIFEYRSKDRVDPATLVRMNDRMRHRGPDDSGYFQDGGIGLGMRRLSVIDLAGGSQPIANEDGSVQVVFNGEIYGYMSIRKRLAAAGHSLRTQCDTEVIAHLYEEQGLDCAKHLEGMFAFALYDKHADDKRGRLLLARDRLGKKPLYYADTGSALIFGSELKAVLEDPRVDKELDWEALYHFLSLQVVPAPLSIFRSVRKVPAGCLLVCDSKGVRVRRYWDYCNFVGSQRQVRQPEALGEIENLVRRAVEERMVADVPLGAFLSGGLDSSVVVALMAQLSPKPIKTFSVGFEDPGDGNELPYARALALHCGADHREYFLRPDIVETIEEIVPLVDEPFAISSAIPTYLISRAAREHVKVVLTGDGGDEVFGGYRHYLYARWGELCRRTPFLVSVFPWMMNLISGSDGHRAGRMGQRIEKLVAHSGKGLGHRRLAWANRFLEADKRNLFLSPVLDSGSQLPPTESFLEASLAPFQEQGATPDLLLNLMDVLIWLPDEMLAKVDRMTMAASLEARCPLLDRHLVEYLAGVPFTMKIPSLRVSGLKDLLRRIAKPLLPPDLLKRPKQGFNVPLDDWFRSQTRAYLECNLHRLGKREIFAPASIDRLFEQHQSGARNLGSQLYTLLVFEIWAQSHL